MCIRLGPSLRLGYRQSVVLNDWWNARNLADGTGHLKQESIRWAGVDVAVVARIVVEQLRVAAPISNPIIANSVMVSILFDPIV